MPFVFLTAILLVIQAFLTPSLSLAALSSPVIQGALPDLAQVVSTHGTQLSAVASDAEAIAFLTAQLGQPLMISEAVDALQTKSRPGKSGPDPEKGLRTELVESATRLVGSLVAWHWSDRALQAAQAEGKESLLTWVEQSSQPRQWLTSAGQAVTLSTLSLFAETLTGLGDTYPDLAPASSTPPCTDYSTHLDRTYPLLAGQTTSWLGVAQQDGLPGLKRRLDDATLSSGLSLTDQRICARTYVQTRLYPVLHAHLVAQALQGRAEAERDAQTLTDLLRRWPERRRELHGLTRLCGTWQWSIHNHRHHQETKTTMTFPPPDGPPPPGLRPSKIVVLGDAIYIRWDFQGGFQEESLLFTGEGARLEGSFVNSTGAWGSITGKRTAACAR
ncbi:MAG: hypothetical protein HZB35_05025 [Nitrospirae bacterium]|nr:hypothetical protein [Nitrospirota bacterium]